LRAPAAFQGKTPEQLALRSKYNVTLVAVKRANRESGESASPTFATHVPHAGFVIEPGDLLMLVGPDSALKLLPN
ncbi:MAG TPA: TrkA C-terminal domain-containing protein, partial [Pirellulaceae bacterium]|nr:TrkA C-terminal domain-containing protein [Pirellulaceae bacterium]